MSVELSHYDYSLLSKQEKYTALHQQFSVLLDSQVDSIANLANATALLKEIFGWWWVGFYRVINNQLVLGPFQGPIACTTIARGKGVCGKAWHDNTTLVVPNVEEFPGHIACSAASKSEIVVPVVLPSGQIWGVLDVDSEHLACFDDLDKTELEKFCRTLASSL